MTLVAIFPNFLFDVLVPGLSSDQPHMEMRVLSQQNGDINYIVTHEIAVISVFMVLSHSNYICVTTAPP